MNALNHAMLLAVQAAKPFQGATSPNPCVGAAALDANGNLLGVAAHEQAGSRHAEAKLIEEITERGLEDSIHMILVTLEPCNHQGRTPPCTEKLLSLNHLKKVVFAVKDPNPIAQGGESRLRDAGLEIAHLPMAQATVLTQAFCHKIKTGFPFVTVKTALDAKGSMIPPIGQKTFTQPESLKFAHELRRRADVIVTGIGTVLADFPEFTVRNVPDHRLFPRTLVVMDRKSRTPKEWLTEREKHLTSIVWTKTPQELLEHLSHQNVLEVLLEAGPELTKTWLASGLWNEHVEIKNDNRSAQSDQIRVITNVHGDYTKIR